MKADSFDIQVLLQKVDFLSQGYFLNVGGAKSVSQHIAKIDNYGLSDSSIDNSNSGPGGFPSMIQIDPVLKALNANGDKEISKDEIDGSAAALKTLDKNNDGKISEDDIRPNFGNQNGENRERGGAQNRPQGAPGGFGSLMRFLPVNAALDADESGEISDAEMKNASTVLQKLDRNNDGLLTDDEVSPQFGDRNDRRDRRRGGGGFGQSGAAYASVIAIDFGEQHQYVQLTATSLVGISAADGTLLWRYDKPANSHRINCTTPLYQDGYVFAASAYDAGGGVAKLSKDAEGNSTAEEVWFSNNMKNHHGGVVVIDGAIYGANGGNEGGYLICLDFKTGDILWNERDNRGVRKGSILAADGMLYYRTEEGAMLLIEPSREKYIEKGRFQQPDRSRAHVWAHPVIANGKLYVRDQDVLFCYDVKAKGE